MHLFEQAIEPTILESRFVNAQTYNDVQHKTSIERLHVHFGSSSPYKQVWYLERLCSQAIPGASHDSAERYPPPRRHPNTRTEIVNTIDRWVEEADCERRVPCFLLSGSLGAGKTAIAQDMAEKWHSQRRLAASCFLMPTAPDRKARFIATIAYQLTLAFPSILPHIGRIIENDLSVFNKSLESQMALLIVHPFRKAYSTDTSPKRDNKIVIIDGLDGAYHDEQEIFTLLTETMSANDFLPFILLLTTRPGPHIMQPASCYNPFKKILHVALDACLSSSVDIGLFMREELRSVKRVDYLKSGDPWPPDDAVERLVEKSSGQFLYASAVVNYVCSPFTDPKARLQHVVEGRTHHPGAVERPFGWLDSRYKHVLRSVVQPPVVVMEVLAWLLLYGDERRVAPTSFGASHSVPVTSPAGLEQILTLEPGSIHNYLAGCHSVLGVPPRHLHLTPIRILHPSFIDFLADRSRSGEFFLDQRGASARILKSLLRYMVICRMPKLELTAPVYDPMFIEDTFLGQLRHARPTAELKCVLEDILGFDGWRYQHVRKFLLEPIPEDKRPVSFALSCDTSQAIANFLEKCYEHLETRPIRRFMLGHRLILYRIRNVFQSPSCNRQSCLCHECSSAISSTSHNYSACLPENVHRVPQFYARSPTSVFVWAITLALASFSTLLS